MNQIVKIFSFALFLGSALGGGRYNRGVSVVPSAPVYSRTYTSPVVYSKSVGGPAVAAYAGPAIAAYHAPHQYQYVSPYANAVAAPAAVQYAAPVSYAAPAVGYASHAVGYAAPAVSYGAPAHVHAHAAPAALTYTQPAIPAAPVALLSTAGKPQVYGKSIGAAAVRNIETVMVTKTITPVVTKTTTHHTSAEPALSVGHVQGYSQQAVGHAKIAPVQFNTQYTSYSNPTVGVNGPVSYSGAAVGVAPIGVAAAAPAYAKYYAAPAAAQYQYASPYAQAVAAVPEPVVAKAVVPEAHAVYKTGTVAYAAAPAVYKTAAFAAPASYSAVVPGAALSYDTYGLEAHSLPQTNFIELRSGNAVLSGYHK